MEPGKIKKPQMQREVIEKIFFGIPNRLVISWISDLDNFPAIAVVNYEKERTTFFQLAISN